MEGPLFQELNATLVEIAHGSKVRQSGTLGARLDVPRGLQLSPERINLFLRQLGLRALHSGELETLNFLLDRIYIGQSRARRDFVWIRIGGVTLDVWRNQNMLYDLHNRSYYHKLDVHEIEVCAIYVALGWMTDSIRQMLDAPLWSFQLVRRLPEGSMAPSSSSHYAVHRPAADERHQGWVRYHLRTPARLPSYDTSSNQDYRHILRRELVRLSKRSGQELKAQKMPASLEVAEKRIRGITPLDRRIDGVLQRFETCYEILSHSPRTQKQRAATTILRDSLSELMRLLSQARDVRWENNPIAVQTEAITLELVTHIDAEGHIELAWQPEVHEFLEVGSGYIFDGASRLHPLDPNFPDSMRPLLQENLPKIPPQDADRFIQEFVLRCPIPVRLDNAPFWGAEPSRVDKRLFLSEDQGNLLVEVRFGYETGEQCIEIKPEDPSPLVTPPLSSSPTKLLRRRTWEQERIGELAKMLGKSLPARLNDYEAYDFLSEQLPTLPADWVVFGQKDLVQYNVRNPVQVSIVLSSEIDWFDLEVQFETGSQQVQTREVLETWLSGKRYHRLQDGSIARLPHRWLELHAEQLSELEELRKTAKKQLEPWAAPLVDELLAQANQTEKTKVWRDIAGRLTSFEGIPAFSPKATIQATLRDYQEEGVRWLAFLRDARLHGILADDMGLGKTLQTIVVLADTHAQHPKGPVSLIVAPLSVVHNWAYEIARFAPSLRVHIHHGPQRSKTLPDCDIAITSYGTMRSDVEMLRAQPLQYIVLDEAQNIKNPDSKVSKAARVLRAEHRLALTGTPLENNLYDLWSIFSFLMPGFFGSKAAFTRRYATPIHRDQDTEALTNLRRRIKPFVLRRLKTQVARELPPRQEQVLSCELPPAQRRLYESVKETYRHTVLSNVEEKGVGGASLTILEALMRLRQACCHPRLLPMDEARAVSTSGKLNVLMETVTGLVPSGHRALIFSQWPSLLRLVATRLEQQQISYLYLDGSTRHRQNLVTEWNRPDGPPIFLISLKAGGAGLNLTGADCVIHLDPWWNPAVENQAIDRSHRIGQKKTVFFYKFITQESIEEKILQLQRDKANLSDDLISVDEDIYKSLSAADLGELFEA